MIMIGAKASEEARSVIRYRANPPLDNAVRLAAALCPGKLSRTQPRAGARMFGSGVSICPTAEVSISHLHRITKRDARPAFAISDIGDCVWVNPGYNCQGVHRNALTQKPSDVDNLLTRQFAVGTFFPPKVNKALLPLVLGIPSKADPFKVFNSVIEFVSVNVVDGKSLPVPRNKSDADKSVHKTVCSLSIFPHVHLKVTVPSFTRGCNRLLKVVGECRHFPVPVFPGVFAGVRRSFYSPISAYKPLHALGLNFFPNFHGNSF